MLGFLKYLFLFSLLDPHDMYRKNENSEYPTGGIGKNIHANKCYS